MTATPFRVHAKVLSGSVDRKSITAPSPSLAMTAAGPLSMIVSGTVVSTTDHSNVVTGGSVIGAVTSTWTENVWRPVVRPSYTAGDRQGANATPSSEHEYVTGSGSLADRTKVALVASVAAVGPLTIVTGDGILPIVQLNSSGDGSTLPAASLARTSMSCSPTARSLNVTGEEQSDQRVASSSRHSKVTPVSEL